MAKRTIYHGSENIIKVPLFGYGNRKNDYGLGFYCTESRDLALEWGSSEEKDGFANEYVLETDGLSLLNLSDGYTILHWLSILLENRTFDLSNDIALQTKAYVLQNFSVDYKQYDLLQGFRADDSYFSFANAFLNNAISLEKLNRAMYLGKLGEQIVLKSEKAFSHLSFVSSIVARRSVYYPKKMSRDIEARKTFRELRSDISPADALFAIDLIRQEVNPHDPRIPAILCD